MRKIGFTLGLFLLISFFATGTYSAGPAEGKKKKAEGVYAGVVAELDQKANRMVVAQNNTDLAMVFNTSKAKDGSGYKELSEVKVGDQVKVKFEAKAGIIYALDVSKGEKPVAKAKQPTHPAAK
jgi:hypothetical protein